ncbi:MAG: hypothetical protein A3J80_03005 [Desulfobacula sp. RIFOXYB2_FULL_45_6]|nr:MAG: hypothetical protein A3J80_03005 [Desulfobacula sp. RIFOXYB2_FULL_45_6]
MTSLTELTGIIKTLPPHGTNYETGRLQKKIAEIGFEYSDNPALTPLLKMMQSLAKYIDSKKEAAHPDSLPVLLSISEKFERVSEKNRDEINKIVSVEIQKYKTLQTQINSSTVAKDIDLNKLKAVILAIDWEISDETLRHFEKVVTEFLSVYQQNKILHSFLKMIRNLGFYIGSRKANAHPDAVSLLRFVFENFEKAILTPGMSFTDKKDLLEKNINQFHELKARISKDKKQTKYDVDIMEEEFLTPALSHIKTAKKMSSRDIMPLTLLSEEDGADFKTLANGTDDIKPALSDRENSSKAPRDVMGDLFSLKESPADELLDAIHLMDVHGPNRGRASQMMNHASHPPSSGIKQFTPELKHNEPIPEIEDRLDEFFNLESSPRSLPASSFESPDQTMFSDRETVELSVEPEDDKTEGIIPFQYEDESFEPGNAAPEKQEKDQVQDTLSGLKLQMETLDGLKPEPALSSIKNNISGLKTIWQNDPEKTHLLDLLSLSLKSFETLRKDLVVKKDGTQNNERILENSRKKPPGIIARIKTLFTS